jgi:NAD(P)-dependent dehydrogenase (short-subunit alcohol dehydrogenase family)
LVERAVARGDHVIAAVRSQADLDSFQLSRNLHVVRMDVSSTQSVEAGFADADRCLAGAPLDIIVNCAAICPQGAVEIQPPEAILDTLNTNAVGSARMIRAGLPRLRGHKGRIVLVTSLWGKVSGPMLSAYCASKFAIEAIADAARREVRGQDVGIILVEPGVVRTRMVAVQVADAKTGAENLPPEYEGVYGGLYRGYANMIDKNAGGGVSAEECAKGIEAAAFARKPKARYRIGVDAKVVTALARWLPDSTLDAVFGSLIK